MPSEPARIAYATSLRNEMELSANSNSSQLDPISPELVLVDPELAEQARSRLQASTATLAPGPPPPEVEPLDAPANGAPSIEEVIRRLQEDLLPVQEVRPLDVEAPIHERERSGKRIRRGRLTLSTLVVLFGVGGGAAALYLTRQGGDSKALRAHATPRIGTNAAKASQQRAETSKPRGGTRPRGSTTPGPKPASRPKAPKPARATQRPTPVLPSKKRATQAQPPAAGVPTRVFIWPAVKRAVFYKVQFLRHGHVVFEASPSAPRLELPLRWTYQGRSTRLVPGKYAWRVSPAFGSRSSPRYGQPIVRSTWVARA